VLGVDPAAIDPVVLKHRNFTHIRERIHQTKRLLFQNVHWLIADMNVAPNYTLNVLEEFSARKEIPLQGMLFTLKLFQWALAEKLPEYKIRLQKLGFNEVRIKQLTFNRQEVMIAARKSVEW
jgi:ubiquinone/menaquinone biosynthesis C-methylase UbiE